MIAKTKQKILWPIKIIAINKYYRDKSKKSIFFRRYRYDTIYRYRTRYIDNSIYRLITNQPCQRYYSLSMSIHILWWLRLNTQMRWPTGLYMGTHPSLYMTWKINLPSCNSPLHTCLLLLFCLPVDCAITIRHCLQIWSS